MSSEQFKNPCVALATPCYGSQCFAEYTKSLIETIKLFTEKGIGYEIFFILNESLVQRARNNLTAKFMANKNLTHLMFIDADIAWKATELYDMIMTSHFNDEIKIIGGVYPKKTLYCSFQTYKNKTCTS